MDGRDNKILGVIGGMGPLATELFYKMVIDKTDASRDQDHIDMVILNHASMPDRTKAILEGHEEEVLSKLVRDAVFLKDAGARVIAIPCNTSHHWIKELDSAVGDGALIVNMIETGCRAAARKGVKKVCVLATDGTIRMGLYEDALRKEGIEPYIPSAESQKLVMKLIYDGVKNGSEIDFSDFETIEKEIIAAGCDAAIMACTELSCLKIMYNISDFYIDAMEETVKRVITECGKKVKVK